MSSRNKFGRLSSLFPGVTLGRLLWVVATTCVVMFFILPSQAVLIGFILMVNGLVGSAYYLLRNELYLALLFLIMFGGAITLTLKYI